MGAAPRLGQYMLYLVMSQRWKCTLAGARIPHYHLYADKMNVNQYIHSNKDPLLARIVKQGKKTPFVNVKVIESIENYWDDSDSLNYGALWMSQTSLSQFGIASYLLAQISLQLFLFLNYSQNYTFSLIFFFFFNYF